MMRKVGFISSGLLVLILQISTMANPAAATAKHRVHPAANMSFAATMARSKIRTFEDGPLGTPHFTLIMRSSSPAVESGSLSFAYQDGRTKTIFSFQSKADRTSTTLEPVSGNLHPMAQYHQGGVTLVGCRVYLAQFLPNASCNFTSSPESIRSAVVPNATSTNPSCIYTPSDFANAFLNAIPEPDSSSNVEAIIGWEEAEGGNWHNNAEFNPLNTTYALDGSTSINGVGVQSYSGWTVGVTATVATIENGYYGGILSALAAGNSATTVATAVGNSKWGTPNFSDLLPPNYNPPAPSWESPCPGGSVRSRISSQYGQLVHLLVCGRTR